MAAARTASANVASTTTATPGSDLLSRGGLCRRWLVGEGRRPFKPVEMCYFQTVGGMKTCGKCSRRRQLRFFSRRGPGYQSWCRDCQKEYKDRHYRENKSAYVAKAKVGNDRYRRVFIGEIHELKRSTPCVDCGKRYPHYVMDFDHRDPDTKKSTIARLLYRSRAGRRRVMEEIAKCDLVCANCHRERTWGPRNRARSSMG